MFKVGGLAAVVGDEAVAGDGDSGGRRRAGGRHGSRRRARRGPYWAQCSVEPPGTPRDMRDRAELTPTVPTTNARPHSSERPTSATGGPLSQSSVVALLVSGGFGAYSVFKPAPAPIVATVPARPTPRLPTPARTMSLRIDFRD